MNDQKTVLVTGAGSGIGRGIALHFGREQHNVVVFDLNRDAAEETVRMLGIEQGAIALEGDVSNEGHVRQAIDKTMATFGRLDVLVNNAGIEVNGTITDLSAAQWDRQIAVNLRGPFLFSKHAVPHMRSGASIIHIASVHSLVSWPECAAYDSTKTGLIGLTRAMALDHGPQGIRVNAICPGYIATPMQEQWLARMPDPEAALQEVIQKHALRRVGQPQDIAQAAFFLASETASFITGTLLTVDGGLTALGH